MTLAEHLRELRGRVIKSALAVVVGAIIGWIYYAQIFDFLRAPVDDVVGELRAQGHDVQLVITGVAEAFTLQVKVACITGVILAAPVWIYQLWRFVTPGLHKHERRWAYAFLVTAVPLFFAGVALAYILLPAGLKILFGFTPDNVANFLPVDAYLSFFTRMVVLFGVSFLTPLFIIMLNLVGVLSGKRLASWWRGIVFGIFLFAAVATPTGDPITMLELALPIFALVGLALLFCCVNDKRRAKRGLEPDYDKWGDDETSDITDISDGRDAPTPRS